MINSSNRYSSRITQQHINHGIGAVFLGCAVWPSLGVAASNENTATGSIIMAVIVCVCVLQLFVILSLQASLKRYRHQREEQRQVHQHLESRLVERSEKLRNINNQLYDEIAKHEITEELLRETQDYIHSMINSMPSILIGVTRDGIITHWNAAAQQATSLEHDQTLGLPLEKAAPELGVDIKIIEAAIDTQKPQKRENIQEGHGSQARYRDLTVYPLISAEIEGAVIRIDDVTLRVRLETMMIQNEKMRSLGELAAGVAHEINNPLSAVIQGVQNIYRRTSRELPANMDASKALNMDLNTLHQYLESRKIFSFLDDIKDAGERAATIVTNMLEFSRAQDQQHEPVNIVSLLEKSLSLALKNASVNKQYNTIQTEIIKEIPEAFPRVPCSAPEIQQVLLNLISNAHQAFSGQTEKQTLKIKISLIQIDNNAIIEVEDNGPGMDSWVRRHIFDPFFTTKEVGKGTGLGLSVSYFIITEHHHGNIEVESTKDVGTKFRISLPLDTML